LRPRLQIPRGLTDEERTRASDQHQREHDGTYAGSRREQGSVRRNRVDPLVKVCHSLVTRLLDHLRDFAATLKERMLGVTNHSRGVVV
jgi:hypothetical protein